MEHGEWNARSVLELGRAGSPLPATRRQEVGARGVTRPAFNGLREFICFMLLSSAFCLRAWAQGYSINWSTLDGGGGTSTAGPMIGNNYYSVSGTIDQPDAGGPMTNGQYSVTGGFWALPEAVQTEGAPLLTIVPAGSGQATISWTPATAGFVLQETLSLSPTNWVNSVSGATNSIVVPATLPGKFYRLHKP
jgi:hypothetical protein